MADRSHPSRAAAIYPGMTADIADAVTRARELIASGDLSGAEATLVTALAGKPGDAELLYLRALVAGRRQRHLEAIDCLRRALAARADMARAWLALGHAHMRVEQPAEAVQAYARAAALEPEAWDVHFNLGIAHRRVNETRASARDFYRAWRRDPSSADAAKACVAAIGALAREAPGDHPVPAMQLPAAAPSVSVIVCSIDEAKAARVRALYERVFAQLRHETILLTDARSLAEAYNRGIDRSTGDIVVLSHDDIDLLAADFAARVLAHLRTYDVIGPVGATRMTGPVPVWAGHPHRRGWITHHAPDDAKWQVGVLDPRSIADGVAVLDGVFLAARREVVARVRFDDQTFDGFHGYDVDWTYRAAQAGFRLAAAGDLRVVHASGGRYDAVWERYAARFCAKHQVSAAPPVAKPFYGVALDGTREVAAFFDTLMAIGADELQSG